MAVAKSSPSAIRIQPRDCAHKVSRSVPRASRLDVAESQPMSETPIRSYAKSNLELSAAFARYVSIRGFATATVEGYTDTVSRFIDSLGSASVVVADRAALRRFLGGLLGRGVSQNTVRRHTCALRLFFKFLQQSRLTFHNPTAMLAHRALPRRLPRVLTITEVDRLIAAAKTPLENGVLEFLYSTGVRVSELASMRLEDVDLEARRARVVRGKGQKDRIVLFGSKAVAALQKLDAARPSRGGWLFESPERNGRVTRPLTARGIRTLVSRVARRAGVGRVHPHSLRRAFATHMLEGGADLRVIQTLLGHTNVSTTALYTGLSSMSLKETHTRCHPTAGGRDEV